MKPLILLMTLGIILSSQLLLGSAWVLAQDRALGVRPRTAATNENRVALVIGNSAYRSSPLRNPVNDARAIANALRRVGFDVQVHLDVNRKQMRQAIRKFGNQLKRGGVGLFFYAGHGMQVNGRNFLIPVGVEIQAEDEVVDEAVDAGSILRKMQTAGNHLNMVFLDACRNNPFARSFRSGAKGLAQMDAPMGSLVAYATAPGKVAADGSGENGTFTANLLRHLEKPGLELSTMMKQVRSNVARETGNKQIPWDSSSLTGEFYFVKPQQVNIARAPSFRPGPPALKPATPPKTIDVEETFWRAIENSKVPGDFEEYLKNYPQGRFGVVARLKLRQLNRKIASRLEPPRQVEAPRQVYPPPSRAAMIAPRGGRTWREVFTGMEFVYVPGGSFQMGCHVNSLKCDADEKPSHTVRLSEYWLGKFEVTLNQFKQFVAQAGYRTEAEKGEGCREYNKSWKAKPGTSFRNPGFYQRDSHPVTCVSWNDATAFAKWISGKTGYSFRLPSEAEWEYACREGGKAIRYSWGNVTPGGDGRKQGNLADDSTDFAWRVKNYNDGFPRTAPVGSFPPNALGLYDMSGNLWEWIQDKKINFTNAAAFNPLNESIGTQRVLKGGGWNSTRHYLECANREPGIPTYRSYVMGFRLVRTIQGR